MRIIEMNNNGYLFIYLFISSIAMFYKKVNGISGLSQNGYYIAKQK